MYYIHIDSILYVVPNVGLSTCHHPAVVVQWSIGSYPLTVGSNFLICLPEALPSGQIRWLLIRAEMLHPTRVHHLSPKPAHHVELGIYINIRLR